MDYIYKYQKTIKTLEVTPNNKDKVDIYFKGLIVLTNHFNQLPSMSRSPWYRTMV